MIRTQDWVETEDTISREQKHALGLSPCKCLSILVLLHLFFFFFPLSLGLLHVNKRDTRRAPCPNPCPKVSQPRIHPDHLELLCRKFSPLIGTFVSHVFKILTHKIPSPRSLATYLRSSLKVGLSLSVAVIL